MAYLLEKYSRNIQKHYITMLQYKHCTCTTIPQYQSSWVRYTASSVLCQSHIKNAILIAVEKKGMYIYKHAQVTFFRCLFYTVCSVYNIEKQHALPLPANVVNFSVLCSLLYIIMYSVYCTLYSGYYNVHCTVYIS